MQTPKITKFGSIVFDENGDCIFDGWGIDMDNSDEFYAYALVRLVLERLNDEYKKLLSTKEAPEMLGYNNISASVRQSP